MPVRKADGLSPPFAIDLIVKQTKLLTLPNLVSLRSVVAVVVVVAEVIQTVLMIFVVAVEVSEASLRLLPIFCSAGVVEHVRCYTTAVVAVGVAVDFADGDYY